MPDLNLSVRIFLGGGITHRIYCPILCEPVPVVLVNELAARPVLLGVFGPKHSLYQASQPQENPIRWTKSKSIKHASRNINQICRSRIWTISLDPNIYIKKFSALFMSKSDPIIKIIKTGMFPISDISYGRLQTRTHNVNDNLEPIKKSMEKFGQLAAITIFENNGKYELLTGQRRLNAAIALGWSEIRADLIEKPPEDLISKAISFIENEIRQKMSKKDVINTCNEFYFKYASIKAVSEELALPYYLVREAVKLPRCPPEVQQAVETGVISLKTAIKATDALKWDADKPRDGAKVLELGKRLEDNMPRELQKSVIEVGKADPDKPIDDIIKEAKSVKKNPVQYLLRC